MWTHIQTRERREGEESRKHAVEVCILLVEVSVGVFSKDIFHVTQLYYFWSFAQGLSGNKHITDTCTSGFIAALFIMVEL